MTNSATTNHPEPEDPEFKPFIFKLPAPFNLMTYNDRTGWSGMHIPAWDAEGEPVILVTSPDQDGNLRAVSQQRGENAKAALLLMIKRLLTQ